MLRFIYLVGSCRDSRSGCQNLQQEVMKIEASEVGLPSRTSHFQSLSGREDCGGQDLWISGVGLEEKKKEEKRLLR